MALIKVSTQSEFEKALEQEGCSIELLGSGVFTLTTGSPHIVSRESSAPRIESWESSAPRIESWGSSAPHIVSRESSAPHIESWESSAPRIVSWESSAPRIVSRDSSAPHIVSWESSAPRIESRESSAPRIVSRESSAPRIDSRDSSAPRIESRDSSGPHIVSWGSSAPRIVSRESSAPRIVSRESSAPRGKAGKYSHITVVLHDNATSAVDGATVLRVPTISDPSIWCDYYGADVVDGIATLYKAVDANFRSERGFLYAPGTMPEAPDWDGPARECGGGLHFCSSPSAAKQFYPEATRYVQCKVALADLVTHENATYPDKIKGLRICAPIVEVDFDGEQVRP